MSTFLRGATILALAAALVACRRSAAVPVTTTQVVNLSIDGRTVGEERAEATVDGRRETLVVETNMREPRVHVKGTLVLDRARAISLHVEGEASGLFPATADVTVTGDRTDTFPIVAPLPVHILAALARQSIVGARREFHALPEGMVTIQPCAAAPLPYADATCHEVSSERWGPTHVFLDTRRALAAAVIPTTSGLLVATTPERDASQDALRAHFAAGHPTR